MGEEQVIEESQSLIKQDGEIYALEKFNSEEQDKIKKIADQFDIDDSQGVVTFGVGAQRDIASFSDNILNEVRTKDSGYVGEVLTGLVDNIKGLKVDELGNGGVFWSKVPIIGSLVNEVKSFISRYEKLSVKIDAMLDELDKSRMGLLKDITLLDNMYEKNVDYLRSLDIYIAAGQLKIEELCEKVLPAIKVEVDQSKDAAQAQKYHDMVQAVNRFAKKVHDMKLSRMIAIQTAPQIRLIQNGNQTLVEKIQSSVLNTIPLWKNQIVIAISLLRQSKTLKLQKEITSTTNDLLKKNSEMLKSSTLDIARESEKGIVEIETLQKVNADLLSTIEETLKIQSEGRAQRKAAEGELLKLESDLKNKLVQS